jgi:hypothetical protein
LGVLIFTPIKTPVNYFKLNIMKRILSISILLLFLGFSAIAGNIVYPWRSTTAIVKRGQTFEVWFNASTGQTVNSLQHGKRFHEHC